MSWHGRLMRVVTAAGAGLLLYVGAPPRELWWLAPVVFAALWGVLHGRPARVGFGYGFAFGLGFFVPLLSWAGAFVGPLPWLALATVEALVLALAGAGVAVVSRIPAAPLWAAGVWVAAEALIARAPFGGFPWGRVAFSQPSGVFLPVAAIGGAPLLTAAVVLTGFGAGELIRRIAGGRVPQIFGFGANSALMVPALLAVAPVVAGLLGAPQVGTTTSDGETVVALVQGNVPRAGLDFNAQRRAVLDNHVARTVALASDVTAGRYPRPALVIWPENSSDIDPLRNPDARVVIDRAARAIDAPILVGAVLRTNDGHTTNTAIVWNPRTGPGQRHDKRPMPFAEYIPYRDFFRQFSPYVERAGDFVSGNGDSAVDIGPARVGIAICSEVMFDDLVRRGVRSGAQLLAVPTNNATFGFTEMTYQQQAISRVRAVEHGRTVLVAATSGVSAVIAPDGTVEQQTKLFTPDALVARVPLRSGTTLATRLGSAPEWVLVALGLLGVAAGLVVRSRASEGQRRGAGPPRRTSMADQRDGGDAEGSGLTIVVIPTYNERDSLPTVLHKLHEAVPDAHALVVDDNSPDDTGELADELAAADNRVHVLHRAAKAGLGAAYVAGFRWALQRGYDVVVEMDADGSHAPEDLPRMLAALADDPPGTTADVVLGSRYVPGGRVVNWARYREWLSRGGNYYSRVALGVRIHDVTGGFRAYRRGVLENLNLATVASQGYCFQVDLAWRSVRSGFTVVEVPITFTEREHGQSKMTSAIVLEALWRVTVWGMQRCLSTLRRGSDIDSTNSATQPSQL